MHLMDGSKWHYLLSLNKIVSIIVNASQSFIWKSDPIYTQIESINFLKNIRKNNFLCFLKLFGVVK